MIERELLVAMVHGLQNGDSDAATKLYETFQSDIYYFILKTVNNDQELAEDLTQDTFIEILETIDKLQEPAAFVTWSKQIAYHRCTAYFRKRKELLVDESEDGYSVFDTIEEDREEFIPDAALDHEDLKQTILNMINDLPEEQRTAILLRYFNEISVKEIADIQGVTEGTVKSRLNYGRKSIRQAVEAFEKKNGIKLHCVGVLPLMLWFFKSYRIQNDLHISSNTAMQSFIINEESAAAAAIIGSSASASAAASTATAAVSETAATAVAEAAVGTAVSVGAEATGVALTTKIVAGIAAATVAVGGVSVGLTTHSGRDTAEPTYVHIQEVWTEEPSVLQSTDGIYIFTWDYSGEVPATEATEGSSESEDTSESKPHEHIWNYSEFSNGEVVEYKDRFCDECGYREVLYQPDGYDACEHNWVSSDMVAPDLVVRCRVCTKCDGRDIYDSYPNPCQHNWYVTLDVSPGTVEEVILCTNCNACNGVTSYPCTHTWEEQYVYDDSTGQASYINRYCSVCHASDRIYVTGTEELPTDPECNHEWVMQSQTTTPEYINTVYECTKCGGLNYENTPVACEHTPVETPNYMIVCSRCNTVLGYVSSPGTPESPDKESTGSTEVPTNAPTEAPTESTEASTMPPTDAPAESTEAPTAAPVDTPTNTACEHDMVMVDYIYGSQYVNEFYECTKCGLSDCVSYPNPCQHTGTVEPDGFFICDNCGMGILLPNT